MSWTRASSVMQLFCKQILLTLHTCLHQLHLPSSKNLITTWRQFSEQQHCDHGTVFHLHSTSSLVYRSLAGTAPVYLADECTLVTAAGRNPLQSADNRPCLVKRSHNQFVDRCFATAGPTLWNSLPEQLRQQDITFGQFKRSLKTFMFG